MPRKILRMINCALMVVSTFFCIRIKGCLEKLGFSFEVKACE